MGELCFSEYLAAIAELQEVIQGFVSTRCRLGMTSFSRHCVERSLRAIVASKDTAVWEQTESFRHESEIGIETDCEAGIRELGRSNAQRVCHSGLTVNNFLTAKASRLPFDAS